MKNNLLCPVCNESSTLLDVVDFNKSCEELKGKFLSLSGAAIYYARCDKCGFCFAPGIASWKLEEFEKWIYNSEYAIVDPDFSEVRPRANAANLVSMFGDKAHSIKHLDYGGGNGLLSDILNESNWKSVSYDPFVDKDTSISQLGKFDLITAFEVFEHVPNPRDLVSILRSLLSENGIVLFSTMLSDGNIDVNQRMTWWYASPRNGHISLFSRDSLLVLAKNNGFDLSSFSVVFHMLSTSIPPWADHLVEMNSK